MKKHLLLLICALSAIPVVAHDWSGLESALDSSAIYINRRRSTISRERAALATATDASDRIRAMENLAMLYAPSQPDSLVYFLDQAAEEAGQAHMDDKAWTLRLRTIGALPLTGLIAGADTAFRNRRAEATDSLRLKTYYSQGLKLYSRARRLLPPGAAKDSLGARAISYCDSLLALASLTALERNACEAVKLYLENKTDQAAAASLEIRPLITDDWNAFHYFGRKITDYYRGRHGRSQEYADQLDLQVRTALRQGILDATLLADIGDLTFDTSDRRLAIKCYRAAFWAQSIEPTRFREHSVPISLQRQRFREVEDYQTRNTTAFYVGLSAIILLSVALLYTLSALRKAHRRLAEASATGKSDAPALLLDLAVNTLARAKDFNTLVDRKFTAGQSRELYADVHSGAIIKEQADNFLTEFDQSVLQTHPDFVERLNTLLDPSKHLDYTPGTALSPELRIAAFLALGLTDSPRMARALGLSLNTIYTYRNRLKSRAKVRSSFEKDLQTLFTL